MYQHSKILLCFNDEQLKANITGLLIKQEYIVVSFDKSQVNFFDFFDSNQIDVALYDKSNYPALIQMKNHDKHRKIPTILILDSIDELKLDMSNKTDEFIVKPVNELELYVRIRTLFRLKKYLELIELDARNWQKKTELKDDELNKLKEYNKHIVEAFPMSMFIIDKQHKIQFLNQKFAELRRTEIKNIMYRYLNEIFNSDIYNSIIKIEINKSIYDLQVRFLNDVQNLFYDLGERIFDISITPLREYGDNLQLLIILHDITEKKKNEWRNHLVQELLSYIQDISEVEKTLFIILTCVTAGAALGFSRAFLLLFDHESGKLEGKLGVGPSSQQDANKIWAELSNNPKSLSDYIKDYDKNIAAIKNKHADFLKQLTFTQSEIDESMKRCFREKKAVKVENYNMDNSFFGKMARLLNINEYVVAPLISNNKPIGIIVADNKYSYRRIDSDNIVLFSLYATHAAQSLELGNSYDNLKTKIMELKTTREKLFASEKMATVGKLAANIAHEIRNPLSTIGGFAHRINKSLKTGNISDVQKSTDIICDEVTRLEEILSSIMDFTRSGMVNKNLCRIKEIVDKSLFILTNVLETESIRIEYLDDSGNLEIICDSQKIKQVLINIFKNSIESIAESRKKPGCIKIHTIAEENFCKIIVSDTGAGMNEESLLNLFSPFFTTKENGTGLGMTIVKNIIEAHNGRINYTSKVNEGTVVTIELPVR
ncbi:PAS domain-containing protein [Candidatus Dependentiae bacterium]|nr:PAS domain-containing protein [Candidatus Dependentiae bacterium]